MEFGRLIRKRKFRRAAGVTAYIVAIPNPDEAVELIKRKAADPGDEVEDLGRVSEGLITALKLQPGEFMRADEKREPKQTVGPSTVERRRAVANKKP